MAETKRKPKSVYVTDSLVDVENEVSFDDCELKIAKPSLAQDKTLVISGNFEDLTSKVKAVVSKYGSLQLTEDNVNYVKTVKSHFVTLRNSIERERKEWKKIYITPASKTIDAMCDDLQRIVAEGENALGNQLDEYDQKRKDELTIILKEYVEDAVSKYELREEYASQIQLKDKYYNKTQNEEDSADDIELQASELKKKQTEYDSGVALIIAECEEVGFLPDTYIRELAYKSAMEIVLEIKADKKASAELKSKVDSGEKIVIGEDLPNELETELAKASAVKEDNTRTRVLRVTYKAEQAKLMAKFFKENNINFEFINTDF